MAYVIASFLGIAVCWKRGDWKHWNLYYPTILYAYIGNLVYDVLTYNHPLWTFGLLAYNYPIIDLGIMALLYPVTVMLYLHRFPDTRPRQLLYIAAWVAGYTALEIVAHLTGGITYHNGWNLLYSIGFNLCMFPLIRLHYSKPLLVWPISAALAFAVLWWFGIPLSR
jgi:hypothetical protein